VLGTAICEVLDCSERGLALRLPEGVEFRPGDDVEGRLRLRHGADVRVEGVVLRRWGPVVSVRLFGRGVPFGAILREQLHLRNHVLPFE
jgi:hypothetical protein